MTTVELAPAYSWDCPDCGRENFQRCVSVVLDPADPADAAAILDMTGEEADPGEEPYRMTTRPDRVTCRHCGIEFKAVDMGTDDEAEEDDEE